MPQPSFDARYVQDEVFQPRIGPRPTFSRASAATVVDSQGRVAWGPENLCTRSEEFDNAAWATKTNVTVTPNDTTAPDGAATADKIAATASAATVLSRTIAGAGSATGNVFSVYAKQGSGPTDGNRFVLRNATTATNLLSITVNYGTGVVTHSIGSGAYTEALPDGWWRVVLPATTGISNGNDLAVYVGFEGTSETAGEYLYAWGAQLERYDSAREYIATTAAAVYGPRIDYDPTTLGCLGLLMEEQRTNLVQYSQELTNAWWTAVEAGRTGGFASPDGGTSAVKVTENTANSIHAIFRTGVAVSSTAAAYTMSFFVKAEERSWVKLRLDDGTETNMGWVNFNCATGATGLSGLVGSFSALSFSSKAYPNGWYRLILTVTKSTHTVLRPILYLLTGDTSGIQQVYVGTVGQGVYVWGAQLELGTFATSYIPTTSSTVTRSVDLCSISGADYTSVWDSAGMTMVCSYELLPGHTVVLTNRYVVSDGFNNRWIHGYQDIGGIVYPWRYDGTNNSSYGVSMTRPMNLALSIEPSQIRAAVPTAANTVVQNGNLLTVPDEIKFFEAASGHIRRFRLYKTTEFTNGRLQGLAQL